MDALGRIIDRLTEELDISEQLSSTDMMTLTSEYLLSELLDPEKSYPYTGSRGYYTYEDLKGVTFFVRLVFQPLRSPFFELKTGWLDESDRPVYEPSVPPVSPNSTSLDWDKRSNTLAKIYRDEILPEFLSQNVSNILKLKPISKSRSLFARRLITKYLPDCCTMSIEGWDVVITKS